MARASLDRRFMKLGVASLFVTVLQGFLVLSWIATARPARADDARRAMSGHLREEDALADEDIDVEDIAARSPFTDLPRGAAARRLFPTPRGSTWISLVGFERRTIDDRREIGGFIVVGLPLERFARGSPRGELTRAAFAASADLVRTVAGDGPFELALSPRLARSAVEAAWRAAGLGVDAARLDSLVSRARWSAALPEARLRAVRFDDARLSLDTGTDTSRLRDSAGANVGLEARVTWRLDRLLYADDEPQIERIRLENRDARSRIGARVLEALFHWQRAVLDLRSLPPGQRGTRDEADVTLRVIESEAALDVLTGGWFTAVGRPGAAPRPAAGPRSGAEL